MSNPHRIAAAPGEGLKDRDRLRGATFRVLREGAFFRLCRVEGWKALPGAGAAPSG